MRAGRRQKVTGLVINRAGPNTTNTTNNSANAATPDTTSAAPAMPVARVPRRLVRRLRAAIHNREQGRPGRGESLDVLRGWAAYIHMTDPAKGRAFLDRLARLPASDPAPASPAPDASSKDTSGEQS